MSDAQIQASDTIIEAANTAIEATAVPIDDLSALKQNISSQISDYSGKWEIYIKDLKTNQSLSINSAPLKSASVIKLFNMMAFYNYINENNLTITDNQNYLLKQMITVSSNGASNSIVSILGKGNFLTGAKYVTNYCKNEGYNDTSEAQELYDTIPEGAVITGANRVSADDCGKALEQIYDGKCINEEYSKDMLDLLLGQQNKVKIPAELPSDIKIAHKTGETSDVDSDVRYSV